MIAVPMMTVMQRLNAPPPPPGTPGPLSRPTSEAIGGLLEGGGFSDVEVEELELEHECESPEEFTEFTRAITAPIAAMVAQHPPDVQAETWAAVTDAVRERGSSNGKVQITNLALLAAGRA